MATTFDEVTGGGTGAAVRPAPSRRHRRRHGGPPAWASAQLARIDWRYALLVLLLGLCALGGGASREDVLSLLYVRPAAVIAATAFMLTPARIEWRAIKAPLILLGLVALLGVIQLIPLPPSWWTTLPGHQPLMQAADLAGIEQPWRPISLAPDLTLQGIVSLVVPLAVLLGMGGIARERRFQLLPLILIVTVVSALLAVGQVTAGAGSGFYLYRVTNDGVGVGLFSNRNHQAMFLACAMPMLVVWAMSRQRSAEVQRLRMVSAGATAAFFVPLVLITGSRTGLALMILALAAAGALMLPALAGEGRGRVARRVIGGLSVLGAFGALIVWAALPRATTLQRLMGMKLADEQRVTDLPVFEQMTHSYWPFGSGLDTFERAYRIAEPYSQLGPQYLNQAHNEIAQAAITGGLAGLALIAALLIWLAGRGWAARRGTDRSRQSVFARLGLTIAGLLLLGSLTDYPLRTPWLASIFAIACVWAAGERRGGVALAGQLGDEAGIAD